MIPVCLGKESTLKMVPILSQMNTVHIFPRYFCKIHCNIILSSTLSSSECSLPFMFSDPNIVCIYQFSHACYLSRSSNLPWLDHSNNCWRVQAVKLLIMQLLQPPTTSSIFSNTWTGRLIELRRGTWREGSSYHTATYINAMCWGKCFNLLLKHVMPRLLPTDAWECFPVSQTVGVCPFALNCSDFIFRFPLSPPVN
jgi:hypothetical protein